MTTPPPDQRWFSQVGDWCQEYLQLQHGERLGHVFGEIVHILGEIAAQPRDGVDRFDWLLERERELSARLSELSQVVRSQASVSPPLFKAATLEAVRGKSLEPLIIRGPKSPDHTLLFVYGTLKRGHQRAPALQGQRFRGEVTTRPRYRMFDCGGYPGLVEVDRGGGIEGELWEVTSECLQRLDEIEGVAYRLYARRAILLSELFEQIHVESYYYLRSTVGLRDCGTNWRSPRHA